MKKKNSLKLSSRYTFSPILSFANVFFRYFAFSLCRLSLFYFSLSYTFAKKYVCHYAFRAFFFAKKSFAFMFFAKQTPYRVCVLAFLSRVLHGYNFLHSQPHPQVFRGGNSTNELCSHFRARPITFLGPSTVRRIIWNRISLSFHGKS